MNIGLLNFFTTNTRPISGIDYTISGNDVYLDYPESWNITNNFVPISNVPGGSPECTLRIATASMNFYNFDDAEANSDWGASPGGGGTPTYGRIYFLANGSNWTNIATSTYNGLISFILGKTANEADDGGYFQYYFHSVAWDTAFIGNQSDIVIAQNGSVYKDDILPENLVVRWDGEVGLAGGGTLISDTKRFI